VKVAKLTPVIYVLDLYTEVRFYKDLGFTVLFQDEEFPDFVVLGQGDVEFSIAVSERFRARTANDCLLWQFQVDDLDAASQLCRENGYAQTVPERYWERAEGWEMRVTSPNGYQVSLFARTAPQGLAAVDSRD
jgi:hypothetical protein